MITLTNNNRRFKGGQTVGNTIGSQVTLHVSQQTGMGCRIRHHSCPTHRCQSYVSRNPLRVCGGRVFLAMTFVRYYGSVARRRP